MVGMVVSGHHGRRLASRCVPVGSLANMGIPDMAYMRTHPGAVLCDELLARGLSVAALASRSRLAARRIQEIVAGKRGIIAETALRLGQHFGNAPEFRLSSRTAHNLAMARDQQGEHET
jgi:addiction module HigA family antidote